MEHRLVGSSLISPQETYRARATGHARVLAAARVIVRVAHASKHTSIGRHVGLNTPCRRGLRGVVSEAYGSSTELVVDEGGVGDVHRSVVPCDTCVFQMVWLDVAPGSGRGGRPRGERAGGKVQRAVADEAAAR